MADFPTFQLSVSAMTSLAQIAIFLVALAYEARIPFKGRIHVVFVIYVVLGIISPAISVWSQSSDNGITYISRVWWVFFFAPPAVLVVVSTTFVLLFLNPKPTATQKIKMLLPYVWLSIYWSVVAFDPSALFHGPARETPTGWLFSPGWLKSTFTFFGFTLGFAATFAVMMGAWMLAEILRRYRSENSPFKRSQMISLLLGASLFYLFAPLGSGVSLFAGLNLGFAASLVGGGAFLLTLLRHGFYEVTPVAEVGPAVSMRDSLEFGHVYVGLNEQTSFRAFSGLVKSGMNGLCVTTVPPNEIRERYGLRTTPVRWLAESGAKGAVYPSDLQGLYASLTNFMKRTDRPVIILDGLEYLVSVNGFKATMDLINRMVRISRQRSGIFIVSTMTEATQSVSSQSTKLEVLEDIPVVHCRLTAARTVEVGETFQVQLDMFNVGKKPALIERVEGIRPGRFTVLQGSQGYRFEGPDLVLANKRIEPLQLESFTLAFQAGEPGEVTLSPKVVFRDGIETRSAHHVQPTIIKVIPEQTFQFQEKEAKSIFSYLAQEFVQDYMMRRQPSTESGWRSLPQISDNTQIPRSTLYGNDGKRGRPVFELLSRGLVEERLFPEGKGRVRETSKIRISYDRDQIRRYIDRGILSQK